jgi:hypothetical protein
MLFWQSQKTQGIPSLLVLAAVLEQILAAYNALA